MPQDRMDVDADEPRRSSRTRTIKYASLDPEYMTNVDVIRNRHEVDNNSSVLSSPTKKNSSNSPSSMSRLRSGDHKMLECSRDGGDEASEEDDEEEDESYVAGEEDDHHDDDDEEEEEEEDTDDSEATVQDRRQRSERTPPRRSSRTSRGLRSNLREESPFFDHGHHVHFSPSSKPGSPAVRRNLRRRDSSALRATRLHNLTSEDEEREFERRYSRDLRSRKRKEQGAVTSKSSGEDDGSEISKKEDIQESPRATRRSSRNLDKSNSIAKEDISDESDDDDEDHRVEEKPKKETTKKEVDDEEEAASASDISGLRRSKRIHKSVSSQVNHNDGDDDATEEDDDEGEEETPTTRRSSRRLSRRNRVPVTRLMYEPSPRIASSRRSTELRNLDQYSTDEEYEANGTVSRRRNGRYNMRENRRTISRYGDGGISTVANKNTRHNFGGSRRESRSKKLNKSYKDSSSSSASSGDASDEERFQRRKKKRMNIERSKLRPVNFNKDDVGRSIFKERQKSGSSLADVAPMEIDLNVTFEHVGGCEQHVNSLKEMVVLPMIYPELFQKFSINAPRGVLFYGPPGTGKTLMARALASECSRDGKKVAFFMRKGADCLSKWIGESERQLRLLFDQAFVMRPSIIFFDEIDGLAPVRSSRQDQIHSSIVSTLLALMDGLDNRGEIIVIGATNRIENIDPALRRPGRFDRELRFGLPTRDARREILGLHTKAWDPALPSDTLDKLADKTIGYCGADIKGLCTEAALNALRRRYPQVYKTSQKLAIDVAKIQVRDTDFFGAMKVVVPSGQRIQDQSQAPLPRAIRPLLQNPLSKICQDLDKVLRISSCQKGVIAVGDEDPTSLHYRPRMVIRADRGQGLTTYLAPAILHHLERLPCHRLDLPALFSNSTRTPEEAICQIVHEAKRTAPACIYIPHFNRLWRVMSITCRDTLLTLLGDILPTMPLLLLATVEESTDDFHPSDDALPPVLFSVENGEMVTIDPPSSVDRKEFFAQVTEAANAPVAEKNNDADEKLDVVPVVNSRELTEKESKRLRKKEEHIQRELRIFLREVWGKVNREQKFFMFRSAVDTEEVDDYLEVIEEPMDFDKMLSKLDNREYKCAKDFLADIDLIAENAITYNSDMNYETNKIICHRARALQDFCYALIKAEMDTDFEDECAQIKESRIRLEKQLEESEAVAANNSGEAKLSEQEKQPPRKKPKKRVSSWARGECKKRPRREKVEENGEDHEEEDDEHAEEEEDDRESGKSNNSLENSLSQSPRTRRRGTGASPPSTSSSPPQLNGELVPTAGVRVDQAKLQQVSKEAVRLTEGFSVEKLERVLAGLMAVVAPYKESSDRTQLPTDLLRYLETSVKPLRASLPSTHHRR